MIFGAKSERVTREIEQLELKLEELEAVGAERTPTEQASSREETLPLSGKVCTTKCRD
jgi:Transposase C of IS166 homeodomain